MQQPAAVHTHSYSSGREDEHNNNISLPALPADAFASFNLNP